MPPVTPKTSAVMKLDSGGEEDVQAGELHGLSGPLEGRFLPEFRQVLLQLASGHIAEPVQMGPGATTFTRMPLEATCLARARLKAMMAAFVEA